MPRTVVVGYDGSRAPRRALSRAVESAGPVAGSGARVPTRIEEADPAEALARAAQGVEAALIVVGARGDSYFTRALRGLSARS